jgi:hypothetical protein
MKHPSDEDLVLFHYAEIPPDEIRGHLVECARCRDAYAELERDLGAIVAAPVPERDAAYPHRVWARVRAEIEAPRRSRATWTSWLAWPRLATAAALVLLALVAYGIGREQGRSDLALTAEQRERILWLAVGDHLERCDRALRELVNTRSAAAADLGPVPRTAERLAADNRLYRATARHAGQERLASLLDELERILVDIANSPETVSGPELRALSRRIQASGLLIQMGIAERESRVTVRAGSPGEI